MNHAYTKRLEASSGSPPTSRTSCGGCRHFLRTQRLHCLILATAVGHCFLDDGERGANVQIHMTHVPIDHCNASCVLEHVLYHQLNIPRRRTRASAFLAFRWFVGQKKVCYQMRD